MSGDSDPTAPMAPIPSDDRTSFGPLPAGARVGKYVIVETLGVGGFGITYRARYGEGEHDFALKEYLPAALARRQGDRGVVPFSSLTEEVFHWGRAQFLDEARALARLEDVPGVVSVLDFFEANGTAYMAMTLVAGERLQRILERDPCPPPATVERLVEPLLVGLEFVHDLGLVHGDIRPANILIDASGRPTLVDFGGTRAALQDRIRTMTLADTPGYAAPEVAAAEPRGPWTDIYGLAATLYHVVTGHAPPSAAQRAQGEDRARAVDAGGDRYAHDLLQAIDAGLKLKIAERPRTIAEWRRMMEGDAVPPEEALAVPAMPARQAPGATVAPTAAPQHRLTVGRIAIALLVVAAAGAAFVLKPPVTETLEDRLRRAEAEAQRQTALIAKMRQDLETRRQTADGQGRGGAKTAGSTPPVGGSTGTAPQRGDDPAAREKAAAEARAQAEEDAKRRAAEERARAEAAAREKAAAEARAQAEEEAKRRAAEERAKAEAAAREKAAAEARARAEEEAKRRAAEERAKAEAAAREKAAAEARARAEEEAKRRAAEERAKAEAAAREKAAAEARAQAEEDAKRRAAEEQAKAEAAAREKDAAESRARALEEVRRRVAEERAKVEAEAAREKEAAEARAGAEEDAKRRAAAARTLSPVEARQQAEVAEAGLRLSETDRKRVQVALTALGHNVGSTAGIFGPRTRAMIAAWQKAQGWPETGYLSAAQHEVLQQQAAGALAKFDEAQKKGDTEERPEAAEAALRLSEVDRKRLQVALISLGHDVGATTGFIGPRTRAMIAAWQRKQGLPETGYLNAARWQALQQQAAQALVKFDDEQKKAEGDKRSADLDGRTSEETEAALRLSDTDRKRVQVALTAAGHEVGATTGFIGPRTRAMISAWQKKQGLPETGYLNAAQWQALQQQAAQALARFDDEQKRAEGDRRPVALDERTSEETESALRLSDTDRKRVQVALTAAGHEVGATTGFIGPRTRAMIAAWQKKQGLPETGYLNASQWQALQRQAAPALARFDEEQRRRTE